MKELLAIVCMSIFTVAAVEGADLTFTVEDIESVEGALNWVVYNSKESYDGNEDAIFSARVKVSATTMRFTLHDVPPGQVAIKLFHDANGNGELDSNALGIPTEGYGFSNNAGRFGPPAFKDAAIAIDESHSKISVRLR